LDGTTIGDVIRKKVINHIKWVKKQKTALKAYTIWAAVKYMAKDRNKPGVARTQLALTISSYKNLREFTLKFIEDAARLWIESHWPSDAEFISMDDNFDPSFTVTRLKDVDVRNLPMYSFKDDLASGMSIYSKFLPLFDGLVDGADES
jgi:uncharacterized protein (UPF0147 family)